MTERSAFEQNTVIHRGWPKDAIVQGEDERDRPQPTTAKRWRVTVQIQSCKSELGQLYRDDFETFTDTKWRHRQSSSVAYLSTTVTAKQAGATPDAVATWICKELRRVCSWLSERAVTVIESR